MLEITAPHLWYRPSIVSQSIQEIMLHEHKAPTPKPYTHGDQ